MTAPLSSISGIVSGIQYRDLVDQIIAAEGRPAQRARSEAARVQERLAAIGTYRGLLEALRTAAKSLRDGSAFDAVSATTAAISGARPVVTAVGSSTAVPGTYRVEVTTLAKAQKLQSASRTSATTALGLSAGSFTINGAAVTVDANDTLASLRDKINAANSGSSPSKVTASILSVGPTDHRLVLTSDATGAAGMSLVNVSGGAPQALGFTDASDQIVAGAVVVAGTDAQFAVDGIPITRSSNTVTDVIQGVTLTLTAEEAGAVTNVTVERHFDGAKAAMQGFVDAYNKLVDFLKQQQTAPPEGGTAPPLYNDTVVRTMSATLPRTLLGTVLGAAADLSTAGLAGVSLSQTGKLSLDAAKFETAFRTRLTDLRTLFSQRGTTTDARVSYLTSTSLTAPGTYDVVVSQFGAQATRAGSGFSGTYADDGTADSMTVTDLATGTGTVVQLANGMTTAQIVTALNDAFDLTAKHKVGTGTVLYGDASGTTPMTAATKFSELRLAGGGAVTVNPGETISYSGTRPDGSTFGGSFVVTDPATKTVGDLVAAIQASYGSAAAVSVSGGTIVVEDATARTSPLALSVTANNEGGGTLDFGASSVLTTGRGAMRLTAAPSGSEIQITSDDYGSSAGFTVAFAGGGTDGTSQLGFAAGTVNGADVTGTIGGYAATGSGRTLVGATGTPVEGLSLSYTGTATGAAGSVTVTVGTGALIERALDQWLAAGTGTLAQKETLLQQRAAGLEQKADTMEARLERRRAALLQQFARMEVTLARFQSQASGVLATLGALTKSAQA